MEASGIDQEIEEEQRRIHAERLRIAHDGGDPSTVPDDELERLKERRETLPLLTWSDRVTVAELERDLFAIRAGRLRDEHAEESAEAERLREIERDARDAAQTQSLKARALFSGAAEARKKSKEPGKMEEKLEHDGPRAVR